MSGTPRRLSTRSAPKRARLVNIDSPSDTSTSKESASTYDVDMVPLAASKYTQNREYSKKPSQTRTHQSLHFISSLLFPITYCFFLPQFLTFVFSLPCVSPACYYFLLLLILKEYDRTVRRVANL
ncbi:hypothetical protein B0H13DRAFT_2068077 [Mycena leptocephala]|nr:hypothetical protein B0H13DRAFT_2068077 [Mycena leptocephala]